MQWHRRCVVNMSPIARIPVLKKGRNTAHCCAGNNTVFAGPTDQSLSTHVNQLIVVKGSTGNGRTGDENDAQT